MALRARLALFPFTAVLICRAQSQLAGSGGGALHMMNTDLAVLEAQDVRKDLPCSVTPSKPVLGFDLRFHTGFDVTFPLSDIAGSENQTERETPVCVHERSTSQY